MTTKSKKSEKIANVENANVAKKENVSLKIDTNVLNSLAKLNLQKSINTLSNKSIYNFAYFFKLALTDKQIQKKFRSFFRRFKYTFVVNFLNKVKEQTAKNEDYILQFVFIKTFFVSAELNINDFSNAKKENEQTDVYLIYLQILSDYKQKNNKKIAEITPDISNINFAKVTEQINYLSKLIEK